MCGELFLIKQIISFIVCLVNISLHSRAWQIYWISLVLILNKPGAWIIFVDFSRRAWLIFVEYSRGAWWIQIDCWRSLYFIHFILKIHCDSFTRWLEKWNWRMADTFDISTTFVWCVCVTDLCVVPLWQICVVYLCDWYVCCACVANIYQILFHIYTTCMACRS